MENKNKREEGFDPKNPSAEEINKEATNDSDNNPEIKPEEIMKPDALEDEQMKEAEQQEEQIHQAQEEQENDAEGKFGEEPKKKGNNYAHAGSDKSVVTTATALRGVRISADTALSFNDIDPEEKNAARIQHTMDHIAAEVVKEGTVGVSEDYINPREESNTAIERETMDSVQSAVAMVGAGISSAAGGATQMGQVFMSTNDNVDLSDKMYHTSSNSESDYSIKSMDHINGVVLNEITESGALTRKRRFIPQRHVLLLGIDPIPTVGEIDDTEVEVATKTLRGKYNYNSQEYETTDVTLYAKAGSGHKLFKTIDITATADTITSVCKDFLPNITNLKARSLLGEIEAIAHSLQKEDLPLAAEAVIPEDIELFPNYKRCSLYQIDPICFPERIDYSCGNTIESVAKFIKYMNKSELVWSKLRIPFGSEGKNIFDGYKMRKNFVGKEDAFDYYIGGVKANVKREYAEIQTVPGINNYAAYINTNPRGRYNTMANFIYRFSDLKRKIDDFINNFAENKTLATVLTQVSTNIEEVEKLSTVLQTGKLNQNSNVDNLAKMGGTSAIILNFDPNDFISYSDSEQFYYNRGTAADPVYVKVKKPYVSVGYVNSFRVDTTKANGLDSKIYRVAPTWIQAICDIYSNDDNIKLIAKMINAAVDSGEYKIKSYVNLLSTKIGEEFAGDYKGDVYEYKYEPFIINSDHPEWIDFFYNELFWVEGYNAYLAGERDDHDGYVRLIKVFNKDVNGVSFKDYINDGGISVSEAISKIISNPLNYPNASARKISDLTNVTEAADELTHYDHHSYQFAILSNKTNTYSFQHADGRDLDIDDFSDYEIFDYDSHDQIYKVAQNNNTTPEEEFDKVNQSKMRLLNACRTKVGDDTSNSAANNSNNLFFLASIGENEFIVCHRTNGIGETDNDYFHPVVIRKRNIDEDQAKYLKRRQIVLASDADSIDNIGEDIADALYGHDDHYWNDNCYAYAIKISKHYNMANGVNGSDQAGNNVLITKDGGVADFLWTLTIVPVEKFKSTTRTSESITAEPSGDVCNDYAVSTPIYKNAFWNLNGALKDTNNKYRHLAFCSFVRGINKLSLYTGRRYPVSLLSNYCATSEGWKFLQNYADFSNNYNPIGKTTNAHASRHFNEIVFNFSSDNATDVIVPSPRSTYNHISENTFRGKFMNFELFIPYTGYSIDANAKFAKMKIGAENLSESTYIQLDSLGDVDVTLAQYWDRQYYITTGYAGKLIGLTPSSSAIDRYDVALYLATCGLPLCPEVMLDIDSHTFEIKSAGAYGSNVNIYGTPGNHINTEMIPMLYEAFDQYADGRRFMRIPARWLFSVYFNSRLLPDKVGICAVLPNNADVNPVIFNRYYKRDKVDYIAFKPIVTLNKNWHKKFNVNRKLYDTYFKKSISE